MTDSQPIIAIIGGGAAGLMTAATLLEQGIQGSQIILFEKNPGLGAKVIISGGGRCNLTNSIYKKKELLAYYPRGADFLLPALKAFGPRAIRRRFEKQGIALKQEEDGRIFPQSNDGKDVVKAFIRIFAKHKLQVKTGESVKKVAFFSDESASYSIITDKGSYIVSKIVVTTGGNAYAHTGSTGDGYAFARALGHTITKLGPSLNSFKTRESWLHECSGMSFPNACIRAEQEGSKALAIPGPVLITHFGISGPATFAFSSHIPYQSISAEKPYNIRLQAQQEMSYEHRLQTIKEATQHTPKKEITSILRVYFTKKFTELVLQQMQVAVHTKLSNINKIQRKNIADMLGNGIPLNLIQRRPGDEFVTAGGVDCTEINAQTGESLLSPGLYFAGEILNVDGYTGGFNLTASWAMGRLVAKAIAQSFS